MIIKTLLGLVRTYKIDNIKQKEEIFLMKRDMLSLSRECEVYREALLGERIRNNKLEKEVSYLNKHASNLKKSNSAILSSLLSKD